jgi:hypothetical protein
MVFALELQKAPVDVDEVTGSKMAGMNSIKTPLSSSHPEGRTADERRAVLACFCIITQ